MSRCAQCGFELEASVELCSHHHVRDEDWAASNRIMCDFLHRGKEPARLPPSARETVDVESVDPAAEVVAAV
jgi:hypothetical protein